MIDLTDRERRVLEYLLEKGPVSRRHVVFDISSPESKIGRCRESGTGLGGGGSSNAEALIFGAWAKRLISAKLVTHAYDGAGYYQFTRITAAGIAALRSAS